MSAYSEKLKDPRWQKKRLEILQRDKWKCKICGCTTRTLHVHHHYYLRDKEPWEYPDRLLTTLCEDCHIEETELREESERLLIEALRVNNFPHHAVGYLARCYSEMCCVPTRDKHDVRSLTDIFLILGKFLTNEEFQESIVKVYESEYGDRAYRRDES